MLVINIVCVVLIVVINILSYIYLKIKKIDCKISFLPVATIIYVYCKNKEMLDENIKDNINKVNLARSNKENYAEYIQKYISLIIIVILFTNILCIYLLVDKDKSIIESDYYIKKPAYGESTNSLELDIETDGIKDKIVVDIEPSKLSEEQIEVLLNDVEQYVYDNILLDNKDLNCIHTKLQFVDSYPNDNNIDIIWEPIDLNLIDYEGNVFCSDKEESTQIKFTINYFDYSRECIVDMVIVPDASQDNKSINEKVMENIINDNEYIILPNSIDGKSINYSDNKKQNDSTIIVMIMGIVASLFIYLYRNNELDKKIENRNSEMLLDYSEVIDKFAIMINAGINLKKSLEKICDNYNNTNNKRKRYIYEEMKITLNELRTGKSEESAYYDFGKRVGLVPYIKLSTMFAQSIKKGNEHLIEDIEIESICMIKERKDFIKQRAAKLGSYLVFPMVMLLAVTITIVILPAIFSI